MKLLSFTLGAICGITIGLFIIISFPKYARKIVTTKVLTPARDPAKKYQLNDYIAVNKYLTNQGLRSKVAVYPAGEFHYSIMMEYEFFESDISEVAIKNISKMMN